MARKVPPYLIDRWNREVDRWLNKEPKDQNQGEGASPQHGNAAMYPPFSAFCAFVKQEARIACNPVISSKVRRNCFATDSNENKKEDKSKRESCYFCKGPHFVDACKEFIKLALPERMQLIRSRVLCDRYLRWGHLRKDCRQRKSCASCSGPHPTLPHDDTLTKDKQDTNGKIPEATVHRIETSDSKKHAECYSHPLIVPVVFAISKALKTKNLSMLFWTISQMLALLRTQFCKKLQINGPQVQLKLSTVLGEEVVV